MWAAALGFLVASLISGCGGGRATGAGATTTASAGSVATQPSPPEPSPPPAPSADGCTAGDHDAAVTAWAKLRLNYPFHLQAVALSPRFGSGCRALIVAEPPPRITLGAIHDLAPELVSGEPRRHIIGYDGWTQDIVVTLPPLPDGELAELIARLHGLLFGTTYRMTTLDTSQPAPGYRPAAAPLDLAIAPGELHRWLLRQSAVFTPLHGGEPASLKALLGSSEPDVYVSDASGLVAWVIPRRADIAEMTALVRQFALESDVIVGAVASSRAVAVLARQRAIDPRVLPPLRFETVSLLAALHDRDQLAQSYERTNPLASRFDGTRDWAPIYLSPELRDTEYGSLLDLADQYLKSWSNNGKTQYVNFSVPSPAAWPFPAPVFKVANASRFRYNWNTANVGAVVGLDDIDVFWLRRTGALNVSYFPDEDELALPSTPSSSVQALEDTAYRFFVQTQTPILARVVQYNTLYQIFARFGLMSSERIPATSNAAGTATLQVAARSVLREVRDSDEAKLARRLGGSAALSKMVSALVLKELIADAGSDSKKLDEIAKIKRLMTEHPDRVAALVGVVLRKQVSDFSLALRPFDNTELDRLADFIVAPHDAQPITENLYPAFAQVQHARLILGQLAGPDLYKRYAASVPFRRGTWIHTPSIVLSWNQAPIEDTTGGHDLAARVSNIKLRSGQRSTAARQIAAKQPVDAIGADELDRLVLGSRGPTLADAPITRPAKAALALPEPGGFWKDGRPAPGDRAIPPNTVRIVKHPDGCEISTAFATRRLGTREEAVEVLGTMSGRAGHDTMLEFEGFSHDEARGMLRSAEIRSRARLAGVLEKPPAFAKVALDFTRARLSQAVSQMLADGSTELGVTVTVPARTGAPIVIQPILKIARRSQESLRAIADVMPRRVTAAIDQFREKPATAVEVGSAIRRDLRELVPNADLRVKLQQEMADFTIVEIEISVDHGTQHHPS